MGGGSATTGGQSSATGPDTSSATAGPTGAGSTTTGTPTSRTATKPSGAHASASGAGNGKAPSSTTAKPRASAASTSAAAAASSAPLKVGLLYSSGTAAAAAAVGVNGLDPGDTPGQAAAIAAYLNKSGGVLGRQIQIVDDNVSAADIETNPDAAYDAACASLTQDDHVALVISDYDITASGIDCFAKAATPLIDDAANESETLAAQDRDATFAPGDFLAGRLNADEVSAFVKSGFLTKTSKVGIYIPDDADDTNTLDNYIKPALAAAGITSVTIGSVDDTAAGQSGAQTESAALSFATAGVDRVIAVTFSPLFLMEDTNSQHYYSYYGLNSNFGPGALLETAAPAASLAGAQAFGFEPYSDIGSGSRGPDTNANETLCFSILDAAGQGSTSATTELLELQLCDGFFFLHDAAAKTGSLTGTGLAAGGSQLGNWPAPGTLAADFPNARVDGAGAYRIASYESNCSCFQYTSPVTGAN